MNRDKPRFVAVYWTDATNVANWIHAQDIEEWANEDHFSAVNVGWVTYEDGDCIVVSARTIKDYESFGLNERIPKEMIVRVVDFDRPPDPGFYREPVDGDGDVRIEHEPVIQHPGVKKLLSVVEMILEENDDMTRRTSLAGKLPSEWRAPLVQAFNELYGK